ncbi:hypothetical protein MUB35_14340 [Blautia sp. NSJ-175]|uniref:hypothetical protein n=1 Tax=Blautia sp. NSJ-175 TaxID=2931396 RepID=UPI001FD0AF49|nr:hypothetical protein [Blautia sp. NSJ-175]MCJ7846506.1 hypothetical protein [Blautia sp. NSJ-175]
MKKKGLVAMGLAGVMTIGMCVPVLAADNTIYTPTDKTNGTPKTESTPGGSASISITEPIDYTVTIPAAFTVDENLNATIVLKAENVNLEPKYSVVIKADSNEVELENDKDSTVKWKMVLKDGEDEFQSVSFSNDTVSNALEKSLNLKDGTNTALKRPAGTYTGTMNFTVSYEAPVTP